MGMEVIATCAEMAAFCRRARRPLGLAPTMGALHRGHLSLARRARADNATMAASIFVNPAQFGPGEDFARYPRAFEQDLERLAGEGADAVFAPPPEEIYPAGFDTWIEPGAVAEGMEGAVRPGHFRGVATVVAKLFAVARPDCAYFGQKDGQQLAVIRKLNADLNLGVNIIAMPTIREADGLALSSRNAYLTPAQRAAAAVIYRALGAGRSLWRQGARDAAAVQAAAAATLGAEPMLEAVDYISVVDAETMAPAARLPAPAAAPTDGVDAVDAIGSADTGSDAGGGRPVMLAVAARLGGVRLIDNVILG